MPKRVYCNVEDHRLYADGQKCEDITSVTLPTIEHTTTEIKAAGLATELDFPNTTRLKAMEFAVSHNNGVNCNLLMSSGKLNMEFRLVRQRYQTAQAEIEHESVKYRILGVFKKREEGSVETDNPLGYTDTFAIIRYEEIVDGQQVLLIDSMTNTIRKNGVDVTDIVQQMLDS